ncbi:MAG: hypothetical protein HY058_14095 [Proteobacteria bacterium]|nr:hypothetical protein [Pseudomonadota bacterium]
MPREMRLIGLDRENRQSEPLGQSFVQAVLGATLSVLLLALPLWALESVNDLAVEAVVAERASDPSLPRWRGNGPGSATSGITRPHAMDPADDPSLEESEVQEKSTRKDSR